MLTFEDCVGYSDLDQETIDAIAEHERVPAMVACELGQSLVGSELGVSAIRQLMERDLIDARIHHKHRREELISLALAHFNRDHPLSASQRR